MKFVMETNLMNTIRKPMSKDVNKEKCLNSLLLLKEK